MEEKKVIKKRVEGEVITISGTNTVGIKVETKSSHPKYEKIIKSHKKFLADTNGHEVEVGDIVTIESTRPISKRKSWIIISKA